MGEVCDQHESTIEVWTPGADDPGCDEMPGNSMRAAPDPPHR
jgi:hypothetical protein